MCDAYSRGGGVLMLGSVPLGDTKTVFTQLSTLLPGRLQSIPDGETGERSQWTAFQYHRFPPEVLAIRPDFPISNEPLKESYTIDSVTATGYDDAALKSYAEFLELRNQGVIAPRVRFQVCLPSPFGVTLVTCKPELVPQFEPWYEQRFRESLQRIVNGIAHEDLLIQWDLPIETLLLEFDRGTPQPLSWFPWFKPLLGGLLERLERINLEIPRSVPIGLHLCYGDFAHKHWVEPKDTALMVDLTHSLVETLGTTHHIAYVHMPVPIGRTDVQYVQPLKALKLQDHTLLCLGLVHAHDDAGTRKRIEVAKSVYPKPFIVATECGLGRTPPEDFESIFNILRDVSDRVG